MSEPIKDGGCAFPQPICQDVFGNVVAPADGMNGMSLRDWFAGMALCGQMSLTDDRRMSIKNPTQAEVERWQNANMAMDAEACYRYADAMLAARDKGKEQQ